MRSSLALAALAILLLTPAARADTVGYRGTTLVYTGETVRDVVAIQRQDASLLLSAEAGDTILAPRTCTRSGAASVSCPAGAALEVDLVDGDDALTVSLPDSPAMPLTVSGGNGNDVLDASASASGTLAGDAGNDRLLAGRGTFRLIGSAGNDELVGGPAGAITSFVAGAQPDGADRLLGGAGTDTADYSARTAPLRLTTDGVADDGAAGEGDDIAPAVEGLVGGSAADVLAGGPGPSVLRAMAGDDTVQARNGAVDQVDCGAGTDSALLDAADVATACETEQRPAPPAPPQLAIRGLPGHASWAGLRRGIRFEVTPSAPARFVFTLLPERRGSRALTRRALPLFSGPRTVTLKPSTKRLGSRRRLTLRVRITAVAAGGERTIVTRKLRVR
jgi:hypothetical protein